MPTQVDPETRKHIREKFSQLIWDQVTPFAYLDTERVEVRAFDGSAVSFADCDAPGARGFFWGNYIEPFLEELCRTETAAISDPAVLKEVRIDFIDGLTRIYWLMADIHRSHWARPFLTRRDTSPEVARMVAYLDGCIAGRAQG